MTVDIPTVVGPPKTKPVVKAGTVPLVYDTKTHRIYVYEGKWRLVAGSFG